MKIYKVTAANLIEPIYITASNAEQAIDKAEEISIKIISQLLWNAKATIEPVGDEQ